MIIEKFMVGRNILKKLEECVQLKAAMAVFIKNLQYNSRSTCDFIAILHLEEQRRLKL
jgi:hypothetical protein